MALVEYGSDSEDESVLQVSAVEQIHVPAPALTEFMASMATENLYSNNESKASQSAKLSPSLQPSGSESAPVAGPLRSPSPLLGPSLPECSPTSPDLESSDPPSPYTATRNLVHSFTLPPSIPEIPASPPGSPTSALVKKFAHFRELKSTGVHFNEKLLRSSTLRNPNLLVKLTAFAGLEKGDEYHSNLPTELWDPKGFPSEGFKDALAKMQAKVAEERRAQREAVEFVRAVATPTLPAGVEKSRPRVGDNKAGRVLRELERGGKSATLPVRASKGDRDGRADRDGRSDREGRDRRDRREGRRSYEEGGLRDDKRDGRDRRRQSRSRSRDRERERSDRRYRAYEYRDRR